MRHREYEHASVGHVEDSRRRSFSDVRTGAGGLDARLVQRLERLAKSITLPIDDVIVREHRAVNRSGVEHVHIRRMHSIVDSFFRPRMIRRRDCGLEIDDAHARLQTTKHIERVSPDVLGRRFARNGTIFPLGKLDIALRRAHVALVNHWIDGMLEDLINTSAKHHVACEHDHHDGIDNAHSGHMICRRNTQRRTSMPSRMDDYDTPYYGEPRRHDYPSGRAAGYP